jgi:hypothetical protein
MALGFCRKLAASGVIGGLLLVGVRTRIIGVRSTLLVCQPSARLHALPAVEAACGAKRSLGLPPGLLTRARSARAIARPLRDCYPAKQTAPQGRLSYLTRDGLFHD